MTNLTENMIELYNMYTFHVESTQHDIYIPRTSSASSSSLDSMTTALLAAPPLRLPPPCAGGLPGLPVFAAAFAAFAAAAAAAGRGEDLATGERLA